MIVINNTPIGVITVQGQIQSTLLDNEGSLVNPASDAALAAILDKLPLGMATDSKLNSILAKLSADPATQTTLAAILAKLSADPATQTTLAAILAKLSADPATETTLQLLKTLPVIYGEPYLSPQDFSVAYTSPVTLTVTGAPFDVDDASSYVASIIVKNAAGVWTKYINAHNGVSITSSSNVITITGAGVSPFLNTDLGYRVAVLGQEKAYDQSTDTEKVTEQSPLNSKYVQDSLVDTTNTTAATTYFPSSTGASMDGFKDLSLSGKLITTGTITMYLEATNDEDTANADWVKVYGYDIKNDVFVNQYSLTNTTLTFAINFNGFNYSSYRIVLVDSSSTNTYIIKSRKVF